ncbi:MAG: grasp-with-spasm system SPASM domain peptide maturase [Sphingobacteriales bacterium]|nr:MAG: grasp-with-spasm system SPASM domain peptide maturase [Sphingobacteriales bacterium]
MKNPVLKVFSSCVLVAGSSRSLIIDAQRWKYYTIPNPMYELLKTYDGCPIQEVIRKEGTDPEALNILAEYFEFLFAHELIFECSRELAEHFVPIEEHFDPPATITNAIIAIEQFVAIDIATILLQLTDLGCYTLEIRINKPTQHATISKLLELCAAFELENLSLIIQLDTDIKTLEGYKANFPFLNQVINYNQEFESREPAGITCTQKDLSQSNSCGLVGADFFTPTLQHYVEAVNHNSCLNRKVAIDATGNIRNCPGMRESFGNIRDTGLLQAINKPGFKKYWNITKDQVTKCKDCEFRYICTDCRAYLDKPDDPFSAPLKCGYNPYTSEWEEWSTNPLKQQAIDYYQMDPQ